MCECLCLLVVVCVVLYVLDVIPNLRLEFSAIWHYIFIYISDLSLNSNPQRNTKRTILLIFDVSKTITNMMKKFTLQYNPVSIL